MKKRKRVLKAIESWWLRRDWRVRWLICLFVVSGIVSTMGTVMTTMKGEEFVFFGTEKNCFEDQTKIDENE